MRRWIGAFWSETALLLATAAALGLLFGVLVGGWGGVIS